MHTQSASSRDSQRLARGGSAMILAIITLIICSSICFSMFRTTTLRQQRFVNQHWKRQSQLIADAALERAYQQLIQQPQYSGEIWNVSTTLVAGSASVEASRTGNATIQVTPHDGNLRQVTIIVHYPATSPTKAQTTLETAISIPKSVSADEVSQLNTE